MKLLLLAIAAGLMSAQTLDEIIAKSLAARGGLERLRSIQTEQLTGTISVAPEVSGPFQVTLERPGKIREQITLNGNASVRFSNGKLGFASTNTGLRPLTAAELANMASSADFDGPLLDHAAKHNHVELLGSQPVNGRDAYKLRVTLAGGEIRHDYIDCESFLEVKWEGNIRSTAAAGETIGVESYFSDYRAVKGVKIAFRIESHTPGAASTQKLVFDKVEVDVPLAASLFELPH